MEFRLLRIALICLPPLLARGQTPAAAPLPAGTPPLGVMRHAVLQDGKPYEVGIGALPTTILLPEVIEAFEANNITTQPNTVAPVFLQHREGTRYFSVKALTPGTADLNVIVKGALYSFRFFTTDQPVRTLTLAPMPAPAEAGLTRGISVRRLYDLLQEAKTYFLVHEQHPELERPIQVITPGRVLEYPGYRVVLDQVFRFERDDTIVIRAVFLNDDPKPRHYLPEDVGLRVGRNLYWPSFAQLAGVIPERQPAELTWETSADVTTLTLVDPSGIAVDLSRDVSARLKACGKYRLLASDAKGRQDALEFVVRYPAPPGEPTPLVAGRDPAGFGLHKICLRQPQPGQNFGYVCYTGTADGQRANLSLENNFILVVPATPEP